MRISKCFYSGCMSLRTITPASRKLRRFKIVQQSKIEKIAEENLAKIAEKKIAELLFERCIDCGRMATIPQGAFAVCKVRRNLERNSMITPMDEKVGKETAFSERPPLEGWELTPLKYNSKLMNSIWGLYNRYSVHNFKKNTDSNEGAFGTFVAVWGAISGSHAPAANSVTATAVAKNNS
ncbi:uncharacterized protein LOC114871744 [Osmia bicornis bicornis]|uniref:uncharacterized protein LOC114871744 n=1 Tax=Osmia bicornis bicornis TaxID=1437191 RepID=UPI0010F4CF27|nr:uncharacterized protein LOC114871744 [Osmia bicornis bicornis]